MSSRKITTSADAMHRPLRNTSTIRNCNSKGQQTRKVGKIVVSGEKYAAFRIRRLVAFVKHCEGGTLILPILSQLRSRLNSSTRLVDSKNMSDIFGKISVVKCDDGTLHTFGFGSLNATVGRTIMYYVRKGISYDYSLHVSIGVSSRQNVRRLICVEGLKQTSSIINAALKST